MNTHKVIIASCEAAKQAISIFVRRSPVRFLLFLVLALRLLQLPALAAVKTWDGTYQGGNWGAWQNWAGNAIPVVGDDVVFPPGTAHLSNTNDIVGLDLNSITFTGIGFQIHGNDITLSGGIAGQHTSGGNEVWLDCTLTAAQTFSVVNGAASMEVNGDVELGGNNLTLNTTGDLAMGGAISGSGNVYKNSNGTLRYDVDYAGPIIPLVGGRPNTYTGTTYVYGGTLELRKTRGVLIIGGGYTRVSDTAIAGNLIIGSGSVGPDIVAFDDYGSQISNAAEISINRAGKLDLNNQSDAIGPLSMTGGQISTGTGTLTLLDDVDAVVATSGGTFPAATIYGNISLSGDRIFDTTGSGGPALDIHASISGSGGLTKTGDSTLYLRDASSYTGTTTINEGTLYAYNNLALGGTAGGTVVNGTAALHLYNAHVANEALTLNSTNPLGALQDSSTGDWNGPVTLSTDVFIEASSALGIGGSISGPGGFTKIGSSTLLLSGSGNSYSGDTVVEEGVLELGSANAVRYGSLTIGGGAGAKESVAVRFLSNFPIHSDADVLIKSDGLLDFNNYSDDLGYVQFDRGKLSTGTGTYTMLDNVEVIESFETSWTAMISGFVDLGSSQRTFDVDTGAYLDLSAPTEGSGGITKTGGGQLLLGWPNTYTGTTIAQEGYLSLFHAGSLGAISGGTVVNNGATLLYQKNLVISGESLELNGLGMYGSGALYAPGTCGWEGPVVLASDSRIRVNNQLEIDGPITGAGALTKTDNGTLTFSGSTANTYAGTTTIIEGTLVLNKSWFDGAIPGDLQVGDATHSATNRYLHNNQIGNNASVTLHNGSLMDQNNYFEGIGSLILHGAEVTMGTGFLDMRSPGIIHAVASANSDPVIAGKLGLLTACTITTDRHLNILAEVYSSGSLMKQGGQYLHLRGSNTYSGVTTVADGWLWAYNASSLGSSAGGTVVSDGASLVLDGTYDVIDESLTLNGYAVNSSWGVLDKEDSGNINWTGPVILNANTTIAPYGGSSILHLSGAISGPGGFIVGTASGDGSGHLFLEGASANTFGGNVKVNGSCELSLNKTVSNGAIPGNLEILGAVHLLGKQQIADSADVLVDNGALFDFGAYDEYLDTLRGEGTVEFGTGGWIYLGLSNGSSTFDGQFTGIGYAPGWTVGKKGSGTFTMNGDNTFSAGNVTINDGTMIINGSHPRPPILLYATATLGGNGTVGHITAHGTVAPGTSPGLLTSSNLTFFSGYYFVELDGYTLIDYDQLDVNGVATLGNANLNVAWGFVPAVGDEFTILDNDGADAVAGTFNGLAEGASVVAGNVTLQISYAGGTGNDVVLAATDVTPLDPLAITSIGTDGGDVDLEWAGGVPFYVVEKKTSLTNATWQAVTTPTRDMAASLPADTTNGFYRVKGGN